MKNVVVDGFISYLKDRGINPEIKYIGLDPDFDSWWMVILPTDKDDNIFMEITFSTSNPESVHFIIYRQDNIEEKDPSKDEHILEIIPLGGKYGDFGIFLSICEELGSDERRYELAEISSKDFDFNGVQMPSEIHESQMFEILSRIIK